MSGVTSCERANKMSKITAACWSYLIEYQPVHRRGFVNTSTMVREPVRSINGGPPLLNLKILVELVLREGAENTLRGGEGGGMRNSTTFS